VKEIPGAPLTDKTVVAVFMYRVFKWLEFNALYGYKMWNTDFIKITQRTRRAA
jgi:hypothetical protein